MDILGQEITNIINGVVKRFDEIGRMSEAVASSFWFDIFSTVFLLIFLIKIIDIIVSKIQKHLSAKSNSYESRKQTVTMLGLIKNIIFTFLAISFIFVLLDKFKINIKPILATAGVAGLAIGFASKRFVEDIIEGFIIISSGQIRIGDYVEINGKKGTVEKLDLKMVTLRDINGNVHFIRSGLIEIITNYTSKYSIAFMELGVSYNEDPDRVIEVLKDIFYNQLKTQPDMRDKIIEDIEISGLTSFEDSSIIIRTKIKTQPKMQWAVQFEFNKLILERFKRENIEIPYNYVNALVKNID